MSKKVKIKLKQGKLKIKLKSGDQFLPLGEERLQQLLGAAMVAALAAPPSPAVSGSLVEAKKLAEPTEVPEPKELAEPKKLAEPTMD